MFEVSRAALIDVLSEMVAIPSVNPDLVPGASGEGELAHAIAARLRRTPGIDVELQEAAPGRPNVIASVGNGPGRTLLLNGHIDTVDVTSMAAPFTPRVDGDRLYGRGSYDMKGSMAGAVVLLEELARRDDFPGRLVVTFVVDEEYASLGSQAICRDIARWQPHAAIVLENTALDVCVAHKGFIWATIATHGVAAHGSRYWLGKDAIMAMGPILSELRRYSDELLAREPHRYLGPPSAHASLITGGQELSSYPERCLLSLERRTIPGDTLASVEGELRAVLTAAQALDPTLAATLEMGIERAAFEVHEDAEIVQTLLTATRAERTLEPQFIGKAGWADSALLMAAGVETVYFGPDGGGAHANEEWVDLPSLEAFTRILASTAYTYCAAQR